MSDTFVRYSHVDDPSDRYLFTSPGSGTQRGSHAGESTSYTHPVYNAPTQNSVSSPPQGNNVTLNGWSGNTVVQVPWTAAQSDLSPFSPTLRWYPMPTHNGGDSLLHSNRIAVPAAHPLIPQVAMPTLTGQPQCVVDDLMDDHAGHCYPSVDFTNDDYTIAPPRGEPSRFISVPNFRTPLSACDLSPLSPVWEPTFPRSPRHYPTPTTIQNLLPFDCTSNLAPSTSPAQYSCGVHHHQVQNHHPVPPPATSQSQPQPTAAISPAQPYTLTVPLSAIELPPMFRVLGGRSQIHFFQCHWASCGIWITSDRDAIKRHLTHAHAVALKGSSPSSSSSSSSDGGGGSLSNMARCEWAGCSSTTQRNGMVRHFHTHLDLKWLCSVCKTGYTRQDSVGSHARKEQGCESARAISHPSPSAYEARMNADDTVTLTKILRP